MARRRLQRKRQRQGLGREGTRVNGRDRATPSEAPLRMGQRRRGVRLGEAQGTATRAWLQSPTEAMGHGADILVARQESQDEQGLQAAAGDRRSVYLRGDE